MTMVQRRRRWLVPFLVLCVIVLGSSIPSLFAEDAGTPSLAPLSATELVAKARSADVSSLSGTVQVSAQLGLPDLGGLGGGGSSPLITLLTGTHSLRVAVDGPDYARIALDLPSAEDDVIRNGSDTWLWQSTSQTVVHVQAPADPSSAAEAPDSGTEPALTPTDYAQQFLSRLDPSTVVSVGTPSYVADRPAYNLVLEPRTTDSTIDRVVIAVDASTGLPLDVQVFARGGLSPAFEVGFTSLSLSQPDGSVFAFTPPPGATVVESSSTADLLGGFAGREHDSLDLSQATFSPVGTDWGSVAVVANVDLGQRFGEIFNNATQVALASGVTGRLISTALVNVLVLDDHRVLIGAVTAKALEAAAGLVTNLADPKQSNDAGAGHGPANLGFAIETEGLTKRFGKTAVVDRLDLQVPGGSVFGFLGPNGSGKTTTIRMLLGLINPSDGVVRLFGREIPRHAGEVLTRVGSLVEGPAFYPWLSGRDNLERYDRAGPDQQRATLHERVDTALERVGLVAAADKRYKAYSLGMRQRLAVANALLRPRDMLILDEPTNGMDPQGTREMRNLIRDLASQGTTVFVSSHLLAEIEQVCTHVAVMSLGRLVTQGAIADLTRSSSAQLQVRTDDVELACRVFTAAGLDARSDGTRITATLDGQRPEDLCRALVEAGVGVAELVTHQPSLEDAFVALTGEGFDLAR